MEYVLFKPKKHEAYYFTLYAPLVIETEYIMATNEYIKYLTIQQRLSSMASRQMQGFMVLNTEMTIQDVRMKMPCFMRCSLVPAEAKLN